MQQREPLPSSFAPTDTGSDCEHDMGHPAWNPGTAYAHWTAAIGFALIGAAFDVRSGRIPNLLTGPALLAGLAAATISGGGSGLVESVYGCVTLGVPFVLLFLFAGGGAGDAKLMAAVGAWIGLSHAVPTLLAVLLAGAVLGVIFALWKRHSGAVASNLILTGGTLLTAILGRRGGARLVVTDRMLAMPYGVAIALGVCLAATWEHVWRG